MRPRIILHAGTPKTGTTSIQHHFLRHREALLARGILYPSYGTDREPDQAKHQWLVGGLCARNSGMVRQAIRLALAETGEPIDTVILSSEGLFNHWWDFSRAGRRALTALASQYTVELWVWFRDPISFFTSNYIQVLKNGRSRHFRCYGEDLSPEALLAEPWFARHLDYIGFVRDVEHILGAGSARLFTYAEDTVESFCKALEISTLPALPSRYNASLGEEGVALLRLLNGADLRQHKAPVVKRLMQMSDRLRDHPFVLPSKVVERIKEISGPSLSALQREFGLCLDSVYVRGGPAFTSGPTETRTPRCHGSR